MKSNTAALHATAARCQCPSMRNALLAVASLLLAAASAQAQGSIPPPAVPITLCLAQAPPTGTTWQLSFDGGANEPAVLTAYAAPTTGCPAGTTHTATLPAARFTVGTHTVKFFGVNEFGSNTSSPGYSIKVGVAPGTTTVLGIKD